MLQATIFAPRKSWIPSNFLLVRTRGNPAALASAVRTAVHEIDPNQPIWDVRPYDDRVNATFSTARLYTVLLAAFAGLALLLAAIGLWQHVSESQPMWDIRVSDGDSLLFLHYDHRTLGTEPFGYMVENRVLRQAAGDEYRVFGIHPDYSSIGEIQDVEVVGPIATNEWVTFVDLIASPRVASGHRNGSTFALTQGAGGPYGYNLATDYPRARPLLDWAGVRYIVLDNRVFHFQARVDQFALEFANREMIELDLLGEIVRGGKRAGAGVVDVKSFYVETAEDVAERVRACLEHVPPDQLTLVPDCGFFQLPRWLCVQKLRALAAGVGIVRRELAG